MEPKIENLSKLDAVQRQLKEAIRLFFERRDAIAIHTLAAATHQVLHDICKKRGHISLLKDLPCIKEERKAQYYSLLNREQNFFKHADKDSEDILNFRPEPTIFYLFDCIEMYHQLQKDLFPEATAFRIWFSLKYPDLLNDKTREGLLAIMAGRTIDTEDYATFLRFISKV